VFKLLIMEVEEIKRKKVTTKELKELKINEVKTFYVPTTLDIESARNMIYRLARIYPENGIKYSTEASFENKSITITVISNA